MNGYNIVFNHNGQTTRLIREVKKIATCIKFYSISSIRTISSKYSR